MRTSAGEVAAPPKRSAQVRHLPRPQPHLGWTAIQEKESAATNVVNCSDWRAVWGVKPTTRSTARRWAPAPWLDDDLQQITVAYLRLPDWPLAAFGAVPRALDAALGAVPRALHASPAFVACALDAAPHAVACWSPESQSRRSEGRGAVLGPQLQTPLVPRTPNLVWRVPEWKIFDATEFLVHPFPSCLAPFWHKNKQLVSGKLQEGTF